MGILNFCAHFVIFLIKEAFNTEASFFFNPIYSNMEKQPKTDDFSEREGRKALIDRYNINDHAHAKSSPDDFVETISGFHHANEDPLSDKDSKTV